jgi:Flp pilus assembly secretin CpaC
VTDALNIFAFQKNLNFAAFIKALQDNDVLQILAEPNLVTTNGREANFLVGGEFPVPVLQGEACVASPRGADAIRPRASTGKISTLARSAALVVARS